LHHATHPLPQHRHPIMPTRPELPLQLLELRAQPCPDRDPSHDKPTRPGPPADVREAQKVKRLGFAIAARPPLVRRVPPKFEQPRLLRMEPEPELLHTLLPGG